MVVIPEGAFLLSTIDGRVGAFVKFGQWFLGSSRADAKWSHVAYVGANGDVYQAMPSGAEIVSIDSYIADLESGDEVRFFVIPELTPIQIERATHYANVLVEEKRGYSYGTYLALFLKRIGFNAKWLRKIIASRKTMICSQLVDQVYTQGAGYSVFRDGRAWLDVTPADFIKLYRESGRLVEIYAEEAVA